MSIQNKNKTKFSHCGWNLKTGSFNEQDIQKNKFVLTLLKKHRVYVWFFLCRSGFIDF